MAISIFVIPHLRSPAATGDWGKCISQLGDDDKDVGL